MGRIGCDGEILVVGGISEGLNGGLLSTYGIVQLYQVFFRRGFLEVRILLHIGMDIFFCAHVTIQSSIF